MFACPSGHVLVKPNFLHYSDESRAVTPHPSVIRGMLRILLEEGYGNVMLGVVRKGNVKSVLSLWSRIMNRVGRPVIDKNKCLKCGVCVEHCPVEGGAIHFENGKNRPPVYDYSKCIRC